MKNFFKIPIVAFIADFVKKTGEDSVAAYAAQAALFLIISFFPFAMLLFAMLQYIPVESADFTLFMETYLPNSVSELLQTVIREISEKTSDAVVPISILTALWSSSTGFHSIISGLNSVYGVKETRNSFGVRVGAVLYTLFFALALIITLVLWAFGNSILIEFEEIVSEFGKFSTVISVLRSTVGFLVLALFFWLIYIFVPNRKTKALRELPGALVCAAGWIGFSFLFSFYFNNFSNYSYIYGSLTAVVLLMLWVYFCMYIMLIGAEINWYILKLSD